MSAGGYYDIDSILSEEVRVPCVFALDAVGMGMLDPTTSDEDLSQGAKVRRRPPLGPRGGSVHRMIRVYTVYFHDLRVWATRVGCSQSTMHTETDMWLFGVVLCVQSHFAPSRTAVLRHAHAVSW